VVCGRLIATAAAQNVRKLREAPGEAPAALKAYARAGHILGGGAGSDRDEGLDLLFRALAGLVEKAALPAWETYGFEPAAIPELARQAAAKTNPVALDAEDYERLLAAAIR
jgi:alcohol dehydrogenase class IV